MNRNILSVRMLEKKDIESIMHYFFDSDSAFLYGMGVDINKLPKREEFIKMLTEQMITPIRQKKFYYIIWQVDNEAVGHSNVNNIIFGEEAYMHLHIWNVEARQKGFGTSLVKMTLPYFFKNLKLKKLYCQPYALNTSPNKTLEKIGFEFVKEYVTIPGQIQFEQPVNLWVLSYDKFKNIK